MNEQLLLDTAYRIVLQERFRAGEAVFAALNAEKIPYAVHKGIALSMMLYHNPTARQSGISTCYLLEKMSRVSRKFLLPLASHRGA